MEIYRFSNWSQFGHFANLQQFTIDSYFSNFKKVTIDPSLLRRAGYERFTSLGKILGSKKQSEDSIWQQIQEPCIDLSQVIFNDSVSWIKNWLSQLTNRL